MAKPLFQAAQDITFDAITTVFGWDASWTPSLGGATQLAKVLFSDASERDGFAKSKGYATVSYMPYNYQLEYRKDFFIGLMDSVRDGNIEYVTVNGIDYAVQEVKSIRDGQDYIAGLELKIV